MRCEIGGRECSECGQPREPFRDPTPPFSLGRAEAADGAGDSGAGRLCGDHCPSPRGERESVVLVATTISTRGSGTGERPGLRGVCLGSDCSGADRCTARAAEEGYRGTELGSDRHRVQWWTTSE